MANKIKKFDEFINEDHQEKMLEITFPTMASFNTAYSSLYDNGFRAPSFHPPEEEYKNFTPNEHWKTMTFKPKYEEEVLSILSNAEIEFSVKFKEPIGYKVFYHGGYYD